jgi:tripartite-type tricarboxylate transporter receptor subunit TctC
MRSVSGIRSALIVALTLCSGLSLAAESEKFPSKAIRIVVPFAAGGGGDFIARAWADKLSDTIKQPVIVENRGGGNTVVGTDVVAKAAPDGYTLLLVGASIATNPALIEKLPYKTPEDFTPIGTVITYAMGLAARANLPATNVQELLALEKAQGPLSIATSGDGSATALAAELFKGATGIKLMAVPYKGAGPAAIDVASGHVDLL